MVHINTVINIDKRKSIYSSLSVHKRSQSNVSLPDFKKNRISKGILF